MKRFSNPIRIGDQAFLREGGEEVGSVRIVDHDRLVIYVENATDFVVLADAVKAVHDGKVILDEAKLDPAMRDAVRAAHQREEKGI